MKTIPKEIIDFIEWLQTDSDGWYLYDFGWSREGYETRTTQKLYEYYLKYEKNRKKVIN